MKFIADLHCHSKFSRATSEKADLDSSNLWAKKKGIKVIGSTDFTHPQWFKNLKQRLEPAEPGLYTLNEPKVNKDYINLNQEPTRFLLSTEISCVYSKDNETRKIHILVFAPDFDTVEEINTRLGWEGKLESDGRPTLGMDAEQLTEIVLNASQDCLVVPAHLWTPHFSLFGSKSGFDSLEACFGDYTDQIHAVETGLSSDPPMNWRLSALDDITLISNSDAHSSKKLGREANVFEGDQLSYQAITEAIKKGSEAEEDDPLRLVSTIEFYPQEGKYHYDGHRKCEVRMSPQQSKKSGNICPVCGKPLTIGVMNRVEQLADREQGFEPENVIPFKSLIPLEEIVAEAIGQNTGTKRVIQQYQNLIENLGPEFEVLLSAPIEDIRTVAGPKVAEGVKRVREEQVQVEPGYDGKYGELNIFTEQEQEEIPGQKTLFQED